MPGPANNRRLGIGLCLAAAACLVFAAFTTSWLVKTNDRVDIGFGLRSNHDCQNASTMGEKPRSQDGEWLCQRGTNSETVARFREWERPGAAPMTSSAFAPLGWVTFVDLLIVALGLAAAAAIAIARKQPQLPITPSTIALVGIMIALISGCVFVATKPGPNGMVGVGLSFWLFGVGCVLGIAGAQLIAKVNRPPEPDLMADAMNPDDY